MHVGQGVISPQKFSEGDHHPKIFKKKESKKKKTVIKQKTKQNDCKVFDINDCKVFDIDEN